MVKNVYVELRKGRRGKFTVKANLKDEGIKNIASTVKGKMGNLWEKMGFIRSAK